MKHISEEKLDTLEPLLAAVRAYEALKEKKRGVFYLKSRAFLHFHEDAKGLFADARLDGVEFTRFRVSTKAEQAKFLTALKRCLKT